MKNNYLLVTIEVFIVICRVIIITNIYIKKNVNKFFAIQLNMYLFTVCGNIIC